MTAELLTEIWHDARMKTFHVFRFMHCTAQINLCTCMAAGQHKRAYASEVNTS